MRNWLVRLLRLAEQGIGVRADRCLWCDGAIRRTAGPLPSICARCAAEVPWIEDVRCAVCGRGEACPDCVRRPASASFIVANRAAVRYTPFMKEWLARYKYRGSERLEPLFTEMAAIAFDRLRAVWDEGADVYIVVTYVPLSERRLEERGFNQAETMARGIGRRFGLPVVPLLNRSRHTEKQSYKSRRERLESLSNAFDVDEAEVDRLLEEVRGRSVRIVLTDDVYTTGSTLHTCGEVLHRRFRNAANVRVYGITWAR